MEGIRWLDSRPGTVAVSAKGGDKVAGALYAWMIEGLAHVRALGTAEGFVNLLEEAHAESTDVERLLAGSVVLESGSLRLSASEGTAAPIEVQGRIGGDWFPLVTLAVGPERVDPLPVPTVQADGIGRPGQPAGRLRQPRGRVAHRPPGRDGRAGHRRGPRGGARRGVGRSRPAARSPSAWRSQAEGSTGERSPARSGTSRSSCAWRPTPPPRPRWRTTSGRAPRAFTWRAGTRGVGRRAGPRRRPGQGSGPGHRRARHRHRRPARLPLRLHVAGHRPPARPGHRRCFSEAMANDEVVVFEVLPECQPGGSAVK